MEAIKTEVYKLIKCSFIRKEQHPDRVANIVHVLKKAKKIRVCVDFQISACPKDEFSLPITDVMIDNTCDFKRMSSMDDFSGYNQIKMHPNDEKHSSFRTPLGYTHQCRSNWRMWVQLINIPWAQFSVIIYKKRWNVMLTTLQSRVAAKATISTTWE